MTDSALPYNATIQRIDPTNRRLTVLYSADSSIADSDRPDILKNINMPSSLFTDSGIENVIKLYSNQVRDKWNSIKENNQLSDSLGFNEGDYVNRVYSFVNKTTILGAEPDYNQLTSRLNAYDSEDADYIYRSFSVVSMGGDSRQDAREALSISRTSLWDHLLTIGKLDSVSLSLGSGDDISASWNASSGAAFDFSSDKIHANGVKNVERVSTGTYRVVFSNPLPSANYTAVTGVGAENYSGTGSSPRQLAVISRAADSLQVHCERTDDAVDEDNEYMAVQISKPGAQYDSVEVEWLNTSDYSWSGTLLGELQTVLGYATDSNGDSDFAQFIVEAQ